MSDPKFAKLSPTGQAERLIHFKQMGDPLADDAVADLLLMPKEERDAFLNRALEQGLPGIKNGPESWHRLLEQVEHVPSWVDWKAFNHGSRAFLRAGGLGMFVLGCQVTPLFYRLSNGNKALSFSGRLTQRASRRGRETARFVIETCLPYNLQRHGDGFKITLRVRLMHAQVRKMIAASGRWDYGQYGVPISQVYMASMICLLSAQWIEGLRHLGMHLTKPEEEGLMQLWRYSAYLIGVNEELLFTTKQEALQFFEMVLAAEPPPDDDARELIHAIINTIPDVMGYTGRANRRMHGFCEGLAVSLLGAELSSQLKLKRTFWRHSPKLLRGAIPIWSMLERIFPPFRRHSQLHGTRLWLDAAEFPPQGGLEMFAAARQATED